MPKGTSKKIFKKEIVIRIISSVVVSAGARAARWGFELVSAAVRGNEEEPVAVAAFAFVEENEVAIRSFVEEPARNINIWPFIIVPLVIGLLVIIWYKPVKKLINQKRLLKKLPSEAG